MDVNILSKKYSILLFYLKNIMYLNAITNDAGQKNLKKERKQTDHISSKA